MLETPKDLNTIYFYKNSQNFNVCYNGQSAGRILY